MHSERTNTDIGKQGRSNGLIFGAVALRIKMGHISHSELPLLPDVLNAPRFRASTLGVRPLL